MSKHTTMSRSHIHRDDYRVDRTVVFNSVRARERALCGTMTRNATTVRRECTYGKRQHWMIYSRSFKVRIGIEHKLAPTCSQALRMRGNRQSMLGLRILRVECSLCMWRNNGYLPSADLSFLLYLSHYIYVYEMFFNWRSARTHIVFRFLFLF